MSARLLLEIGLRVLGFWFFFTAFNGLIEMAAVLLRVGNLPGQTDYILVSGAPTVVQVFLGAAFVVWAPVIAGWFYPQQGEQREHSEPQRAVGAGDIYRTACFVLGAYLLVAASDPAGKLLSAAFARNWRSQELIANTVPLIIYACGGLLLLFGSRPIADLFSNLQYDPDTIPQQRMSIAMLLVVMVVIAAVLGVVRLMAS